MFRFTKIMFNVNKLTIFTATLFTWTSLSHQRYHLSESSRIGQTNYQLCINQAGLDKQIIIYVYVCLLLSEVSLQLKNLPKNIYKNKCHEDEIDTLFNSPCLFTKNALIQFNSPCLFTRNISVRVCLFTFHIQRYLHNYNLMGEAPGDNLGYVN